MLLLIAAALSPGRAALGEVALPHPQAESLGREGSARQLLPELPPSAPQPPDITLPPLPPPAEGAPLGAGPRIMLKEVRIAGNTVLSAEEIAALVRPYLGRFVTGGELQTLRQLVTEAYIAHGYINSGVVLPDQQVTDGVVEFQAVEGKVSKVDVIGDTRFAHDYIADRLLLGAGPPLNIDDLKNRLQIMLQDPAIERMNVELLPGTRPGEAYLRTGVVDAKPYEITATFANNEPPPIGSYNGELKGVLRNFFHYGDVEEFRFNQTGGLTDGGFSFSMPVTEYDTILSLKADWNSDLVIQQSFSRLGISSRSQTLEIGLAQPVYRTPETKIIVGVAFDRRTSESFLLDQPFTFTAGESNGKGNVSVFRASQELIDRSADQVVDLRSTFSFGVDAFGATDTGAKPNSRFTAWLGQAQYIRRIIDDIQIVLRATVQLSSDPLLPLEQIPIGGLDTVRGYRENEMVRDEGGIGSIEMRIPIFQLRLPYISEKPEDGSVQLAPFFDYGRGLDKNRPTAFPRTIYSAGVGLRWDPGSHLQAQIYYGHPFVFIHRPDHDLQDVGIHFKLTATY